MATKPFLLSDNRFADGVPTATDTEAGYDVLNILDWRPYTFWKAASLGTKYLEVDCGSSKAADALAIIGHNLKTANATVSVEKSYGPTERTNPKNLALNSICYAAGLFVAVGSAPIAPETDAYIVTSPDGINWTERANPKNIALFGVTYGAGLFVAVGFYDGGDAYIVTSPDGITWTERANPKNYTLRSVCFAAGQFVAVGDADDADSYIVTSPDGITWTEQAHPKQRGLSAIAYGAGLFVAVGDTGADADAYIITSPDGITWTERANPKALGLRGICYASGQFIAVGEGGDGDAYIVTSPDGITWTERANPKDFTLYGITYGAGLFVAVGFYDGGDAYIVTSPDGITWTERANPKNFALNEICYASGIFVAVGAADGTDAYLLTSPDGITWTEVWTEVLAGFTPADDKAFLNLFTSASAKYWRLKIVTAAIAPYIAIACLGSRLTFERFLQSGFDPQEEKINAESNKSLSGNILGSVIEHIGIKVSAKWKNLTDSWCRNTFKPVWDSHISQLKPFFFAWNYGDYPADIVFVKVPDNFGLSMPYDPVRRELDLDLEGIKEV